MTKVEICAFILFSVGMYGVIARKNIIKSIMSLSIMELAVILFFLSINYEFGKNPPIGKILTNPSDPFPQALMITAIVIGVAVTAFSISMFIGLYHKYGTSNWGKALKMRKDDDII